MNDLRDKWFSLAERYSKNVALLQSLYDDLLNRYMGKNRHYHSIHHIAAMLKGAEDYSSLANDYDALQFAIWYHDIIYNSLKSDNEEKSAEEAGKALHKLNYPAHDIEKVKHMILRTKKHMEKQDDDKDTQLLLDLDLAILGADREKYIGYAQQVRKEYSWVPDLVYKPGRKKVLQKFLDADSIYRLEEFRSQYERKARENLVYEMEELL